MQTRPYPEQDGPRIWLSREERDMLLDAVEDRPRRLVALEIGLHGLRTDEIVGVTPGDVHQLSNGSTQHVVVVQAGN